MLVCLDSLMIIVGHHCVAFLLVKMLIWVPFSQSMCISVLTPANICILTYNEYDIIFYRGLLPDMDDLKIIESGGFGISKVHEIFVLKEDNQISHWKKVN